MNKFIWPVRVYYEDTDAGGVVYYANYLKFMERARTEWLREIGFEQDSLLQEYGMIFAVRQVKVRYHQPARFNEALQVSASIAHKGRASLTFYQEVRCEQDNRLLCSGDIEIACLNRQKMRPMPIPKSILEEVPDVE